MRFDIVDLFPRGGLCHVDLVLHLILVEAQWQGEAVPNLINIVNSQ